MVHVVGLRLAVRVIVGTGFKVADDATAFQFVDHGTQRTNRLPVELTIAEVQAFNDFARADHHLVARLSHADERALAGAHVRIGARVEAQHKAIIALRSGILDAMAQLYLIGIIDQRGRMKDSHPKVQTIDNERQFILVDTEKREGRGPITITQKDIRQLQLAKAAIQSGIQTLLETHGLMDKDIDQIIIAGAFGSYINIQSAMDIGMLPTLPNNRFHQVGNAAGMGAKLALISKVQRAEAAKLASKIHYLELGGRPQFTKTFIQANYIGRYGIEKGKKKEN